MAARFVVAGLLVLGGCSCGEPVVAGAEDGGPDVGDGSDAPPSPGCGSTAIGPGDHTWTLAFGTDRTVHVHVPAGYEPQTATPVVLNFHGYTQNATQQEWLSEMNAKSDSAGFIAVHPEGTGVLQGWNAGSCCGAAMQNDVDDVGFVGALIDTIENSLCVDARRVFATGFSNGAFLSHRLACEMADRIAAAAPVAGVLGVTPCAPSRPVPIFEVHGTADPIVPCNGGVFASVPETIARWVALDGCDAGSTISFSAGAATCETYGGCMGGVTVTLCTVSGQGHGWPGSPLATDNQDLAATDAIWDFFVRYPMP